MSSISLAVCESRLEAHLTKAAKSRRDDKVSLIEIVDEAALWDDPFTDLTPALCHLDFETLITQFPALGCAAAAEVGFRFEGVGTIFWARFEELIGGSIPVSRRSMLADAYDRLAGKFPIQRPAESGFNEHFSIIAWPIANALMPSEVAAPLARLLARGPSWTGSITARRTDLSALRAWARSWEGIRLSEWLQNEASFRRVIGAYTRQSEAFFALRDAKRRRQSDSTKGAGEIDEGLLSLRRIGGQYALTVTWSPLPQSLLDTARTEASGQGWRPRLWGQGSPQHSDQAFGSLPVLLNLNHIPADDDTAFPTADETFGEGSLVAGALRARRLDWAAPMVFLHDAETDVADRVPTPLRRDRGQVWLLDPVGRETQLPILGEVAGRFIRCADLANSGDRQTLQALGLWQGEAGTGPRRRLARHPVDAMTLRRGQVRPGVPFCTFDLTSFETSRLARNERRLLTEVDGVRELTAETVAPDADPSPPEIFVFERQSAFDALIEERLLVRIDSRLGAAEWPVEAMIVCDGEVLAYARQTVTQDGHGVRAESRLLRALQSDHVRTRLLETGSAVLRLRVGNHPWEAVTLARSDGEVDWDQDDPSASVSRATGVVAAPAPRAHHFDPTGVVAAPTAGAVAFAVRLDDGRLASPSLILATDRFELGDLSTNFSDLTGSRQLVAEGRGVLDVARARRAWASAICRSLASVSARLRVVRQFEAPLVDALCGAEWRGLEQAGAFNIDLGAALFTSIMSLEVIEMPEDFGVEDIARFEKAFAASIAKACPTWPETDLDDEAADTALSAAFEATLLDAHAEDRHLLLDPDDYDFGAPGDAWRSASEKAQLSALGSPLLRLIAPTRGAEVLARRPFVTADLAETATFLADWTKAWCLPRSHISKELACSSLQVWLSPGAVDTDAAVRQMARDTFLARAVRYVALRMAA
jgi:hypothetical protein